MWGLILLSMMMVVVGGANLHLHNTNDEQVQVNIPSTPQLEVSSPLHVAQCRANCLQQVIKNLRLEMKKKLHFYKFHVQKSFIIKFIQSSRI